MVDPVRWLSWSLIAVMVGAAGCGSTSELGAPRSPEGRELPTTIEHEPCDVDSSRAQRVDANGDGKPDIVQVRSGSREVCRMLDFNQDGVADSFVYFDDQGRIRRRESDFDRDGHTDEVDTYVDGVIVRKDRATATDGKFHTWDFYERGKIHHRLRDSDGDGKVDQWWHWPNPDKLECAIIEYDTNADGKPDPSSSVDQCAPMAGAAAQGAAGAPAAGDAGTGAGSDASAAASVSSNPAWNGSAPATAKSAAPASSSAPASAPPSKKRGAP